MLVEWESKYFMALENGTCDRVDDGMRGKQDCLQGSIFVTEGPQVSSRSYLDTLECGG